MDKKALECLINDSRKDSIVFNLSLEIFNFKEIVEKCGKKSIEYEKAYIDEKEISVKLQKDLEKSRNWNKRLLIGGPLVGLLVGILVVRN